MADYSSIELASVRPEGQVQEPATGEQTGAQQRGNSPIGADGSVDAGAIGGGIQVNQQAPAGTINTYRAMRRHPTIAIGRMAVHAPIKSAKWTIETDDDAPSGAEDLIEKHVVDHQPVIVREAVRMLDYGRQPFELVWDVVEGALVPDKYKPLLPEITKAQVTQDNGRFAGAKNADVPLTPEQTLWFAFDMEGTNWYGRSLFENIRESAWWPWVQALRRESTFSGKVAGPTLAVGYVPGKGKDKHGAEVDNFDLAQKIGQAYGMGQHVAFPKMLVPWAEDMLRHNVDPNKLMSWSIDFIEPSTGHASEFIANMKHKETGMLRGLMVPERAVTEGQYGTKAESETQAELVLVFAREVLMEIVRCVNWYVVDRILALNYGEEARGTVRIVAEELIDEKAALIREIVKAMFSQPVNASLWQAMTDVQAQLDLVGLPQPETPVDAPVIDPTDPDSNGNQPPSPLTQSMRDLYTRVNSDAIRLAANNGKH